MTRASHAQTSGECGRTGFLFSVALATAVFALQATANPAPLQLLDSFDDIRSWQVSASDDVQASLRSAQGSEGHALCMDFDFGAVSGYAVARRELPLEYGDNYEFSFDLRGDGPAISLQFKLVDASGENVWWVNRPNYSLPHEWKQIRFKKRHISFAWGPSKDRELRRSAQLELVVAKGLGGGKGTVCLDRLSFRQLSSETAAPFSAVAWASSMLAPNDPGQAFDGRMDTSWRSEPASGAQQTLILDFQRPREFGGLVLHWLPEAHATCYTIDLSDDGEQWRTVRRVLDGNGGADPHLLPESEARFIRLRLQDGPAKAYALAEIDVKDLAFGASPNAFIEAIAKDAPRGTYPRAFVGEQSYWTLLGIDGGSAQGLLSEDGALEIGTRFGSIEPFLLTDEGLITWADVKPQQSLLDGYLPIPTVSWDHSTLAMRVTAFATGTRDKSQLIAQYLIENRTAHRRRVTLALAIRPFQVNPPTQFLNVPGGVSLLREISWNDRALSINGERKVFPLVPPDQIIASDLDAGNMSELLAKQQWPASAVTDETGFASAALLYHLELPARASRRVGIVVPLTGTPELPASKALYWLGRQQTKTADTWRNKLNLVSLRLPKEGQPLANTVRTALAHILMSRAGPALQPGSRSYARSWIRDGAMMSDSLLRLGHPDVARDYARWFAPHQFANGKVPCCVDGRGSDPVTENDSQGELIHLIAQHYRYTGDRASLQRGWPHVESAVERMNALRAAERTPQNETEERRAFYGLMPASISHEGYSDRPAYSYWDDFWALAGYNGALEMARALGLSDEAARFENQRDEFRGDLLASLRASLAQHGIDYIPGSADRGDLDPTATTIALSVSDLQAALPQAALDRTFERYWSDFLARHDGTASWDVYTPYELRVVGSFVRMGQRSRAEQLLNFFLRDRRPLNWNQWPEVVSRDARQPRFLGDLPHAWIASDFIQAALDTFAYERPEDRALVLAAGVPSDWLAGDGIAIRNLRTPYGRLTYTLRRSKRHTLLKIAGGLIPPPGGLIFTWPSARAPHRVHMNGRPLQWEKGNQLRIRTLPAVITIERSQAPLDPELLGRLGRARFPLF